MAYQALSVTAPTLSAYDPDNPTQATEELNLALHNILKDMDDATGTWWLSDGVMTTGQSAPHRASVVAMIGAVFDYCEGAISTYRDTGTATLTRPINTTIPTPYVSGCPGPDDILNQVYIQCQKVCHFVYYLWKTETDPLRVKDFIRDMLMAWPLQDIAIDLNDETGTQLKVYPQWKNLET